MKVRLTIDVSDCDRRYLRRRLGKPGLATRKEVAGTVEDWIRASLDDREREEDDGKYHRCEEVNR
jgi:hypothetical protein